MAMKREELIMVCEKVKIPMSKKSKKVKLSRCMPWRHIGGEEI
jgi:hypothetical protein